MFYIVLAIQSLEKGEFSTCQVLQHFLLFEVSDKTELERLFFLFPENTLLHCKFLVHILRGFVFFE